MSATFEEAVQPLLDAYAALNADVEEKEAELSELRDKRNRLKQAVRVLDPDRFPSANAKKRDRPRVGKESVDYVRSFLQEGHVVGEFGTTRLLEHPDYQGVAAGTLSAVLQTLHQEGIIRLTRQGKGSSRYYEVIT